MQTTFTTLFLSTLLAFCITAGLGMLGAAFPELKLILTAITGLGAVAGLVYWLYDGNPSDGLIGAAYAVGSILGLLSTRG